MIGHTKATAGVAGLVKAALALHHRVLPPTIGVTEPNPEARFDESPFYVNSEARPWIRGAEPHPRRAGVSAFGFGGTDFHIVLEEYTGDPLCARRGAVDRWPAELLVWRGTRSEITAAVEELGAELAGGAEPALADVAFTLAAEVRPPRDCDATLAVVAGFARRSARQARQGADAARRRRDARACAERRALGRAWADGRGPGRVPVPRPGLPGGRHGARARPGLSRGARLLRARRPGAGRPLRRGRSAALSSRRRRSPQSSCKADRPSSPRRTSRRPRSARRTSRTSMSCGRWAWSRRWSPGTATASSSHSAPPGVSLRTICCGCRRPVVA